MIKGENDGNAYHLEQHMGKGKTFGVRGRADAGCDGGHTCPYVCAQHNRHGGIQRDEIIVRQSEGKADCSSAAVKYGGKERGYDDACHRVFAQIGEHFFKQRVPCKGQKNTGQYL